MYEISYFFFITTRGIRQNEYHRDTFLRVSLGEGAGYMGFSFGRLTIFNLYLPNFCIFFFLLNQSAIRNDYKIQNNSNTVNQYVYLV